MIDEILKRYYGLSDFIIQELDSYYLISTSSNIFLLYQIESLLDLKKCYKLSQIVDYADSFVVNHFSSIVTTVGSHSYVLIHNSTVKKYKISLFSFYPTNEIIHLEWRKWWIQRSDYILSSYGNIKGKFPILDESIHYYVSFLEMAIYLLNDYDNYCDTATVQHRNFNSDEYQNPLNLMIDIKERDFSEYLKYIFFNNLYQSINLEDLLMKGRDIFHYDLVLARMLCPNYYFHLMDDVVLGKKDEICLLNIISRANEYEDYLKKIISIIEKFFILKKYPPL